MDARNNNTSRGLGKSCLVIIVVAGVERFAYKGVASNLMTFLTDELKMSNSAAAKSMHTWYGITYLLPLAVAFVADSYWDRYSTILFSSFLYILGLVVLTCWTFLSTWMPTATLFLPLYLISAAQGGYIPSLQAFGAEQHNIDDEEEEEEGKKRKFFQWWYLGICSGSLAGNSFMPYVQDTYGWKLGFTVPTVAMGMSVLCFCFGSKSYVYKQKNRNGAAVVTVRELVKLVAARVFGGGIRLASSKEEELELEERPLRENNEVRRPTVPVGTKPEETTIKPLILKLLPTWATLLMFAVIFQQPLTFFTKQGMSMNHLSIPPAALQSVITISIVILVPLYDKLIVPLSRLLTRDARGLTILQRMGTGMTISVLAMTVAACVEFKRSVDCGSGKVVMSITWLVPQYVLLGVSDVFTVVGMQEFFYSEVPASMRSFGIALYLSVFGVGSFVGAFLISVVELVGDGKRWFSDDMRVAELYKYYCLLAMLSALSFVVFVFICTYSHPSPSSSDIALENVVRDVEEERV